MATETTSLPQSQSELSRANTLRQILDGLVHSQPSIAYPKNQQEQREMEQDLQRLYGQLRIGLAELQTLPQPQQRVILAQVAQIFQNVGVLTSK